MNNPFSSSQDPSQEPVPPLSGQAHAVERESAEHAAARAGECSRIARMLEERCCADSVCRSATQFVRDFPCLSVGIAFGLGLLAGKCAAAIDD